MDTEEDRSRNESYANLPPLVLDVADQIGLIPNVNSREFCDSFLRETIQKGDLSADLRFQTYTLRDWKNSFIRQKLQKRKKTKHKCLNVKERKRLFDLRKSKTLKYSTFEEVNNIWKSYANIVLNEIKGGHDEMKLVKCDYHGAYFVVFASRNPSLIGIKGFVVQETKHTFRLIEKSNRILVVPKDGTVFAFTLNNKIYKMNGSYLKMSAQQRSKMKLKSKQLLNDIL